MDALLKMVSDPRLNIELTGYAIRRLKDKCQTLKPSSAQKESHSEAMANVTLALRHLEDAEDRLRRVDAILRHMDAIEKSEAAVAGGEGT